MSGPSEPGTVYTGVSEMQGEREGGMTWRRVTAEFDADLYKVPKPRFFRVEKGELERKTYADGEERLEVRFHGIDVPEGTRVSVVIDGERVCEIAAARSRLREGAVKST